MNNYPIRAQYENPGQTAHSGLQGCKFKFGINIVRMNNYPISAQYKYENPGQTAHSGLQGKYIENIIFVRGCERHSELIILI